MSACKKCHWWQQYSLPWNADHPDNLGECRRYPPQVNGEQQGAWPLTLEQEWCGEFSPATVQREPIKPKN